MAGQDLRGFIDAYGRAYPGEVIRVTEPVSIEEDVMALVLEYERRRRFPILLFEKVGGYDIDIVVQGYPGKSVCYGGLGTPVLTLSASAGLPADSISVMCGHQLPFLSCLIPLYMVKVMCTWRQTLAIWPALVVGGGSFALFQYTFATLHSWGPGMPAVWPMTDIGGSIFSLVCLALFLKFVWRPKDEWKFPAEQTGDGAEDTRGS